MKKINIIICDVQSKTYILFLLHSIFNMYANIGKNIVVACDKKMQSFLESRYSSSYLKCIEADQKLQYLNRDEPTLVLSCTKQLTHVELIKCIQTQLKYKDNTFFIYNNKVFAIVIKNPLEIQQVLNKIIDKYNRKIISDINLWMLYKYIERPILNGHKTISRILEKSII